MKKTTVHKSQQLRDVKKKSLIFSPEGRSNVIESLIYHITKLPKCVIYATFGISILILNMISVAASCNASALAYSDNIDLNFTFNTSLTVSLSSADIIINDLTPGNSDDSNVIDVNIVTNNINGYYLSSTVGNSTDTSPSHNTTNLVHSNGTNTFTSLSPSDSIVDLSTYDTSLLPNPNVWGYSYSIDNQSTWSAYSGLPLYNDTTHVTTLSNKYAPSNDTINFKIGAKASVSQASGEYTNTINFIITAYPHPMSLADSYAYFNKPQIDGYYTMQDMEPGICALAEEESELQVIDVRDNNIYTIAKLKDDRCWMTTNLDLPGGTALYSETSNVPDGYPESAGIAYYTLPESSTEGFDNNTKAFVYNSNRNNPPYCLEAPGCYSYYSWAAATAGSGNDVDLYGDAPYSVCPKKWFLPNEPEYNNIINIYKTPTASSFSKWNEVYAGRYASSGLVNLEAGTYWSARKGGANTRALYLWVSTIFHLWTEGTSVGNSVRCIASNEQ